MTSWQYKRTERRKVSFHCINFIFKKLNIILYYGWNFYFGISGLGGEDRSNDEERILNPDEETNLPDKPMSHLFAEGKTFEKINFKETGFQKGEYENCKFSQCDFSETDLSDTKFIDCDFRNCNLSMAKLIRTTIRDTKFSNCKMLGLLFDRCNEFGLSFSFENCILHYGSFFKTKIRKTTFNNCEFIFRHLAHQVVIETIGTRRR